MQFTIILNYSKRAVQYTQRNPHDTYVIVKEFQLLKKTALILIAVMVIFVLPASASGYIAESAVPFDIDSKDCNG